MAFTGKATYASFSAEVSRDVSPLVSLLAPRVTPLLDYLGDPLEPTNTPVGSTEHLWLEDEYAPAFTLTMSTAVESATADTGIQVNAWGLKVQVGDILSLRTVDTDNEHLLVISIPGANSILVSRAFGGTTNTSLAAGSALGFVGNAKLEGADREPDISRVRVTKTNWVQYMAKPIEISGTMEAVIKDGGIVSEFSYQAQNRIEEVMRDLERSALLGSSIGTIGSSTVRRTMKGVWRWITTTHTVVTFSQSFLDNAILAGVEKGATGGYDTLIAGARVKIALDQLPATSLMQYRDDRTAGTNIQEYLSGLAGPMRIVYTPQMDSRGAILCRKQDLAVKPLRGRTLQLKEYAETKDSRQGEVIGEYTVEVRRADQMVRLYFTG